MYFTKLNYWKCRKQEEVNAWENHRNNKNCRINWQFTNKDARIKLRRLYPSIYV